MSKKDYSYIKYGYYFPVSNIKCLSEEYSRRDAPTSSNPKGRLRHYVTIECPFCLSEFEGRIDRCEFNSKNQSGPRTWCCKKCSLTHKRPWEDPWRSSINNNAEKIGANTDRIDDLTGKYFGDYYVNAIDHTDKFGMVWYDCICSCGNHEIKRSNSITGTVSINAHPRIACSLCLKSISYGEREIKKYFQEKNISFNYQVSFNNLTGIKNGLLRFDFGIKDENNNYKYLIEFQGEQHYKPIEYFGGENQFKIQKEHDNRKREWCKNNNIKLIEIPYNYKNLNNYLNKIL